VRILFVSMELPFPPDTGGRIRVFNLLRLLGRTHEVHLLSLTPSRDEARCALETPAFLASLGTVQLPLRSKVGHVPGIARRLVAGLPMDTHFYAVPELRGKIARTLSHRRFDIVQFEHSYMACHLGAVPPESSIRTVVDFVDIESSRLARSLRVEGRPYWRLRHLLNWLPMQRWERHITRSADMCLVTSTVDMSSLVAHTGADNVLVVPNGVDCGALKPLEWQGTERDILFVGTFGYPPNVDGALYFAREVLPAVVNQVGDVRCTFVGATPPTALTRLAAEFPIRMTGRVDDVRPYYQRSAVCVVPLRAGGGTRLKILEAMALGRPVVSTSVGCEGLGATDGVNIMVADSPSDFAAATSKLLLDRELRLRVAHNARRFVESRYTWDSIAAALSSAYDEMVARRTAGRLGPPTAMPERQGAI